MPQQRVAIMSIILRTEVSLPGMGYWASEKSQSDTFETNNGNLELVGFQYSRVFVPCINKKECGWEINHFRKSAEATQKFINLAVYHESLTLRILFERRLVHVRPSFYSKRSMRLRIFLKVCERPSDPASRSDIRCPC